MNQNTLNNKIKIHIIITLAVMLFIFIQSAMPGEVSGAESNIIVQFIAGITGWNEEVLSIIVRKAAHFTEYAVLGICLGINMCDLQRDKAANGKVANEKPVTTATVNTVTDVAGITSKYLASAWLIGTAYACTDEFQQLYVPDRAGTLTDVLIDSAGVACGILIYLIYSRHTQKT